MAIDNISSLGFVPEKLKTNEIYPKVCAMIDYIVNNALEEFEDVKYKYSGPDVVRDEVIKNIVTELGFEYVTSVMDTITNFQFNELLEFVSLLNLLKGSRQGLELILKLLGFNSVIQEWWEQIPKAEPDTYVITVIMDNNIVVDPAKTLDKVKEFAKHYVYPTFSNIDFKFNENLATLQINVAGFFKSHFYGEIYGSVS